MDDDRFRTENLESLGPIIVAVLGENGDVGLQALEILFDEVAGALVQQAEFTEGEEVKITSTLDEMFSENGTRQRSGNFRGPGLPFLTIAGEYTVLAFNHLH